MGSLTDREFLYIEYDDFVGFEHKVTHLSQNFNEWLLAWNAMIHPELWFGGAIIANTYVQVSNAVHQLASDVVTLANETHAEREKTVNVSRDQL